MTATLGQHTGTGSVPRGVPLWRGVDEVPAGFGPCVVALGVFDGLHRGHRRLVDHAQAVARERGLPVLLVTFDPHPARVLGIDRDTSALSTITHRAELAADAGVDGVCVLRFTRDLAARSPSEFARDVLVDGLRAHAVVVGANFTFGARGAGTIDTLEELGRDLGFTAHGVALLEAVDRPCSSTHIRRCVREGDLAGAAHALGRPHRVDGRRVGDRVLIADDTALPPRGRYRARVDAQDRVVEIGPDGDLRLVGARAVPSPGPVTIAFLDRA